MIRPIVQAGHPVLRSEAQLVDPAWVGTSEFIDLVRDMVETMHDAPGVGLAAPQIGLPIQLVVIEDRPQNMTEGDDRERDVVPLTVLVNPTLEPVGDDTVEFFEGCLSVEGWAGMVDRFHRVRVKALNEHAQPVELDWHGWPARILQHEVDHLRGTLYIDRMDTRTFSTVDNLAGSDDDDDDDEYEDA
jgi:peptide deformylase